VRLRKSCYSLLSQFILIGWATVWITALPLFHTHLPSFFQQPVGVPHTVFSPDLPGEYSVFTSKTTPDASALSVLVSHSPELGFVASWEKDTTRLPLLEQSRILNVPDPLRHPAAQRLQTRPGGDPKNAPRSPHIHGLRAPPAPVS
jgi:hypothetical protein